MLYLRVCVTGAGWLFCWGKRGGFECSVSILVCIGLNVVGVLTQNDGVYFSALANNGHFRVLFGCCTTVGGVHGSWPMISSHLALRKGLRLRILSCQELHTVDCQLPPRNEQEVLYTVFPRNGSGSSLGQAVFTVVVISPGNMNDGTN